jgi:hypothetical protein
LEAEIDQLDLKIFQLGLDRGEPTALESLGLKHAKRVKLHENCTAEVSNAPDMANILQLRSLLKEYNEYLSMLSRIYGRTTYVAHAL